MAHRGTARGRGVTGGDGIDQGVVFVAHGFGEVAASRFVAARDPHRFAQVLFQEAQQALELRIAGGLGDRTM